MTVPVSQRVDAQTVTIANGESLSSAINLGGRAPVSVKLPAGWTAASLTFQSSYDGVAFDDVLVGDGGEAGGAVVEVEYTGMTAGQKVQLNANAFADARFLRVRSGTSGSPVNQGAERVLTVVTREFW